MAFSKSPSRNSTTLVHPWALSVLTISAMAMLWSFSLVPSILKVRWFFIAAASGTLASAFLVGTRTINSTGVVRSLFWPSLYFGYFAIAAIAFAVDRTESLFWLGLDCVNLGVFTVFFLLARNGGSKLIQTVFISAICAGWIAFLCDFILGTERVRLGGYGNTLIAVLLPFCFIDIEERLTIRTIQVASCLLVLTLSKSRAVFAAGWVLLCGSLVLLLPRKRTWVLLLLLLFFLGLAIQLLLAMPEGRWHLVTMISRLTGMPVEVAGTYIAYEGPDWVRTGLTEEFWRLFWEFQPFGMGYFGFMSYSETHGMYVMSLHNMYQAWWLEGGVFGFALGCGMLLRTVQLLMKAQMAETDERDKRTYRAILLGLAGVCAIGIYHQMHQNAVLFALMGTSFGLVEWRRAGSKLLSPSCDRTYQAGDSDVPSPRARLAVSEWGGFSEK